MKYIKDTKMRNKDIIDYLLLTNKPSYNLAKAAEEFAELSLVLQQKALKPNKVDDQEIIDEIGDCIIRLKIIKQMFDKQKIRDRVNKKLSTYNDYINKGLYESGI